MKYRSVHASVFSHTGFAVSNRVIKIRFWDERKGTRNQSGKLVIDSRFEEGTTLYESSARLGEDAKSCGVINIKGGEYIR